MIFIAGGTGFVGGHLLKALAGRGTTVDIVAYACIWLYGHVYWKENGKWPLREIIIHSTNNAMRNRITNVGTEVVF